MILYLFFQRKIKIGIIDLIDIIVSGIITKKIDPESANILPHNINKNRENLWNIFSLAVIF